MAHRGDDGKFWSPVAGRNDISVPRWLVDAAERLRSFFFSYRRAELRDPAEISNLADSVVLSAAKESSRIADPEAYLVSSYKRRANRLAERRKREVSMTAEEIDRLPAPAPLGESPFDFFARIVRRNQLAVALECMDDRTRWVTERLLAGDYTVRALAKQLGVSENTLYSSYRRGLERAAAEYRRRSGGQQEP